MCWSFLVRSVGEVRQRAAVPRRLQQKARYRGGESDKGGKNETDAHPVHERAVPEGAAEHGDGERAPDLAAGVEHAAGGARLVVGDAVEQDRGDRWDHKWPGEPD